jgi:hypothetical protein
MFDCSSSRRRTTSNSKSNGDALSARSKSFPFPVSRWRKASRCQFAKGVRAVRYTASTRWKPKDARWSWLPWRITRTSAVLRSRKRHDAWSHAYSQYTLGVTRSGRKHERTRNRDTNPIPILAAHLGQEEAHQARLNDEYLCRSLSPNATTCTRTDT